LTLYRVRGSFLSLKDRAAEFLNTIASEVRALTASAHTPNPLLDIRSEFRTNQSSERSNSHKRTEFGKNAVTRIFRAAGALDRFDSDVGNYLFLTATLPGDTDDAKWAIAEYAHEIIDNLKSWLSKRLSSRNEFYVWENQKRGALHFHYCIHCPDKNIQAEISREFKREIVRLYNGIGEKHHCNLWGKHQSLSFDGKVEILQARVEVVYKSVGAYMAGYLGGKDNKHAADKIHSYYPKRWFGVSRPLSALIKIYTQKEEYDFESLKDALETMAKIREELLDDVLTFNDYRHKVGEGKTHVSYHTYENQQLLWQSRKMLTHSPQDHPIISSYIALARSTTHELQQCLRRYRFLAEQLPLRSVLYLQDSTSAISLSRGAVSQKQIAALETMFSSYDWSLSSHHAIKRCFSNLLTFNLLTAKYHPQMRFNQFGWLNNPIDFELPLDGEPFERYRGTTSIRCDGSGDEIASSGHVPRDAESPSYSQLSWFSSD